MAQTDRYLTRFENHPLPIRLLLLLILALGLCLGARGRAEGIAPGRLTIPRPLTHFVLKDDMVFRTSVKNIFGHKAFLSPVLTKGDYVSVFSDADGTYYQGSKDCLPNPDKRAVFPALDGGLWIPNPGSARKPKLWFYMKAMPQSMAGKAGVLIKYLDALSAGNIKKDTVDFEDLSFMESIKVEPYQPVDDGSSAKPDDGTIRNR